ncbi:MAG: DUF445 family protein [Gloeomargarita sp. SKYBB_i_bin120]|nr:DUF445 family protein [Gloeomargarita sp. SKYB120]MDW8177568.1 DUF445 family protein [Gloeomargarita sp. SKYBB_i_bin120]
MALSLTYVLPPVLGAVIGYFTNDIAIRMLFRPYRAWYIGRYRVPFTPGLIPSNQSRLAGRIADTITSSLLTPEELQKIARRLLQLERTQAAIYWLLQTALNQVKLDAYKARTAKILAGILHDFLGQSLPRLVRILARQEDFLAEQVNQIFDRFLLEFRLSPAQAEQLADWLLETVLTPDFLRQTLVDFLTDEAIDVIDQDLREQTTGTYWVVANLFGVRNGLLRLRQFCIEEPEVANQRLAKLMNSLQLRHRLTELFQELSLQNLPVVTVHRLRKQLRELVREYLQTDGPLLIQNLSNSLNWDEIAHLILTRLRNSPVMNTSLSLISEELALIIERYLEKDLEQLIARVIPILDIDQAIIDRVNATSPADLEAGIQGIVRSELQAIVNLGGILGFLVGLGQSLLLWWQANLV